MWSVGAPQIADTADGGFTLSLSLLLFGAPVADIDGVMSGDGELEITIVTRSGAVPIKGFRAWQRGA